MKPWILRFTNRVYTRLLHCYPPDYQRHFASEMGQVFHTLCCERYRESGTVGVLNLWLPVLWDCAWTAAYQWIVRFNAKRRHTMEINSLERQLGDLTWSIATGLRAGYSIRQVFESLAKEAPEPAASACKRLLAILEKQAYETALRSWKDSEPSEALKRLADLLIYHQQTGGNLADLLDPLSAEFLQQCGSDPAFYEAMRNEANALGAQVPDRARPPVT